MYYLGLGLRKIFPREEIVAIYVLHIMGNGVRV